MLNLLSILAEKSANKIQEKIQPVLESFYDEGINVQERIYYVEPFYYLNYSVAIEDIRSYPINDFINIFKFCVSNAIYEYIRDFEVPSLIQHIISTQYCNFDIKERLEIYRNCLEVLKEENSDRFLSIDNDLGPKTKILHQITNYLNNNTEINLKGFIIFRLKDYLLDLHEIIEKAVDDFLIDREYNEFIKLLKYFVDIQESKLNIVNVVFDEKSTFKIYDECDRLLNYDYLTNVATELEENNINESDMLISALITIAPNEIIIHKMPILKDKDTARTLENIFPEKIHYCNSCKWCGIQANVNKE